MIKGKFTAGRLLQRWRTALGCMPWWQFVALIFAATLAINLLAATLYKCMTGVNVAAEELERAGWLAAVVIGPLMKTLIAQALVIWLVHKALPKSFWWPAIFSAGVFGGGHQSSLVYLVCMLFIGLVWAFAYQSRFEQRGFAQAFWLVFLIHASNNAIVYIL